MKKIFLAILTFLYLGVSSGVAMEIHYCMGKMAGVELYKTAENEKCGRCGMKGKSGCCSDEHKFFKLSSDAQKQVSNGYHYDVPFIAIQPSYAEYVPIILFAGLSYTTRNNSPPDDSGTEIYLRNCNFRL